MSATKTISISALSSFIMALIILWSCGPSTPSPSSELAVGGYVAALEGCVAQAKAVDGGLAFYEACADKVTAGYRDGGVK